MSTTDNAVKAPEVTPSSVAGHALGVAQARLAAVSTGLNRPAVAAVGAALAEVLKGDDERLLASGTTKGAPVWGIAETTGGDITVPTSAMVLVPAGVICDREVVARIHQAEWEARLEVFTTVDQLIGLRTAFRAWVVETTTTASPFRFGQFTVEADNQGINLTRWEAGEVSRADLLLPNHVWETVDRTIHGSLAMSEALASAGLASSAGVLCVGPPGTGKSQLARIVANEVAGRATVLMASSWAVQRFLTPLFRLAGQLAPSVVVIDDLDLVVGSRGAGAEQLHGFLSSMDEVMTSREGVVVLASTNAPGSIDPAAVRASRFDAVIEMKAPGPQGRYRILERYLAAFPDLDLGRVVRATDGATGADLRDLARRAYLASRGEVTTEAVLAAVAQGRFAEELTTGAYL
jgi:ATPase family protein associated with various cellular activities (AAA)